MSNSAFSDVAVVTGASSGIGAELARQLARAGVKVGLTARRADRLEEVAAEIRSKGGVAEIAPADAGDRAATKAALDSLAERLGPIDLLIANAGMGETWDQGTFSSAIVERVVRVNLLGPCHAIESVLPGMIERKRGRIVGVSSLAAVRGIPGAAAYCASKAGLSTLLESLRVELRLTGVRVSIVHPGYVRTPMTENSSRPQPFLIDVNSAARTILRGIERGKSRIDFPWTTVFLVSLGRLLPDAIYDRLIASVLRRSER